MRKPAVVMTAAVSAVLAGGIMVATTAGAEQTPATPAAPLMVLPELPETPQLSDDPGTPTISGLPTVPVKKTVSGKKPERPARRAAKAAAAKPAAAPQGRGAAQRDVTASQALSTDPHGSVQQRALNLVNESRRKGGCDNLSVDRRLIKAASKHAAEMARRGYFAHKDSRGERAGDRVRDAGYKWSRYGENIARGQDSVAEVVDGWLDSPEHRANIMDCDLREVGVGLAFAADRTPYWVQDFATPQ